MRATIIHAPRDIRSEQVADPKIQEPTDAILRVSATCICGSDLWTYRGINPVPRPHPMGHEYCGIVEEVGRELEEEQSGLPGCRATDECAHEGRSSRGGRRNWPGTPAFAELRASGCLPVPSSIPLRVAALKVRAPGAPAEESAR